MSNKNYPHIFEPLTVRRMTLKNRIMMTPMGTNYAESDGLMSYRHIDYYKRRAEGGTGLIIVENVCVDYPMGSNGTSQLRLDKDSYMPRLYDLTETVHRYGACIGVQINHAGASAQEKRIGAQPVSASDIPSKTGNPKPRPLTVDEIHEIVKKYGEAAKRAQIAGFDCVEIHGGHSYLLSQFISPTTNKRTDEYGGSLENRTRFLKEVCEEVRNQVGQFFPIILRISADEFVEGGNTLEDTLKYLEYVNEYVDIFDVSAALNDSLHYQIDANHFEDGWRSYMAKAVKEKFNKPCVSMGNYRDPKVVEEVLAKGDADLIGIGRGLIADPEWVNKVEDGRIDEIRKCISCNVGCAGNRIGSNRPIRCTVNPAVIDGESYKNRHVVKDCNVVVVGGGTAGMEAACTAAEVGCNVTLIEKEDHLGGLSVEISKFPAKKRLRDFPNYLINRANKLSNLKVELSTEPTVDHIKSLNPDVIVNATGSLPLLPPITGLKENIDKEGSKCHSILNLLNHLNDYPEDLTGKKVVVIGGGAVGLDVVEFFAPKGAEVSIVDMLPVIGNGLDPITKCDMTTLMKKYNVKQMPSTGLKEVRADNFLVEHDGKQEELPFDYGFMCLGMKSNNPLLTELKENFEDIPVLTVGDSTRARRIIEGTMEGRDILLTLERKGFLK